MLVSIRRYCINQVYKDAMGVGKCKSNKIPTVSNISLRRCSGSDNSDKSPEFTNSTILLEDGLSVRELPVIVRKAKDIIGDYIPTVRASPDNNRYTIIKEEFSQCRDIRDIFTMLSRCDKITPNIALAAMGRINEVDKNPQVSMEADPALMNAHLAKGAIVEKLLKVILQTDDAQTLLHAINVESDILVSYKYKFSNRLLLQVIDNKLNLEQLVEFINFLSKNRKDVKFEETIDKLWVGFVERQNEINEKNIIQLLNVSTELRASKSTVMLLIEKKFGSFWWKINNNSMQEILNVFIKESMCFQSLSVVGRWLNTNIHKIDEDSLLDFITKFTKLRYTDLQVESAIERYMKNKAAQIESQVLVVGILNYCAAFRIRNKTVLEGCSKYFVTEGKSISPSFLKSFIFPFGYLYYNPINSEDFWSKTETVLKDKFSKISHDDLLTILISGLYLRRYPVNFVDSIFNLDFLNKILKSDNADSLQHKLRFIDSVMSLECEGYSSSLLLRTEKSPKVVIPDVRIKKLINDMEHTIQCIGRYLECPISNSVLIPSMCPDETYIVEFLVHPENLDIIDCNWINSIEKNSVIAILIHLPEHYCHNSNQLIGPQIMRKRHLRLLGMRVVSFNYGLLCKFDFRSDTFQQYISNSLENAEIFL